MSQPEQLITERIDIWTSAILAKSTAGRGSSKKYELYGIKKLRELILELAVRGKLVPQDANDEPASVLLEKVAIEKAELIKKGKSRRSKPLPEIREEEKPYYLPIGWEWVRLGNTGISATGKTPSTTKPQFFDGNIPFIGPGQITIKSEMLSSEKTLTELGLLQSTEGLKNDILMVCIGGSIGKAALANCRIGFNQQINSIRPLLINHDFLLLCLLSSGFHERLISHSTGSATPIINRGKWELLLVGLPSLPEQHRIVAKVDELMLLCNQLEQQTEASIDAHATLVEVLLATLTDSTDANDLAQNWARVSEYFDSLFTTEQSIKALKQTVMQLAVMGKLVPQNPEDESASVLLEKSHKEKETLIEEGVIKREKTLPLIDNCEKPFDLPQGWAYSRGNLLADFIDPQPSHRTPPVCQNGVPYIGYTDIFHEYGIDFDNARKVSPNVFEEHKNRYTLKDGDFVFGKIGTLGKPFFLPQPFDYCLSANLIVIQPKLLVVNPKFLSLYLDSPILKEIMGNQKTNSTHGVFGIKKARLLVIPLPPLNEQHRIVAKVDELMLLCDQLKDKLQQSQVTQIQLTDVLIEQALA